MKFLKRNKLHDGVCACRVMPLGFFYGERGSCVLGFLSFVFQVLEGFTFLGSLHFTAVHTYCRLFLGVFWILGLESWEDDVWRIFSFFEFLCFFLDASFFVCLMFLWVSGSFAEPPSGRSRLRCVKSQLTFAVLLDP